MPLLSLKSPIDHGFNFVHLLLMLLSHRLFILSASIDIELNLLYLLCKFCELVFSQLGCLVHAAIQFTCIKWQCLESTCWDILLIHLVMRDFWWGLWGWHHVRPHWSCGWRCVGQGPLTEGSHTQVLLRFDHLFLFHCGGLLWDWVPSVARCFK